MDEVWETFGDDTYVPEEKDMGTPEDWQEVERDPAAFEELRRAFGLSPKERPFDPEPAKRSDAGSNEPEQPEPEIVKPEKNIPKPIPESVSEPVRPNVPTVQPWGFPPLHEYPQRHVHPVTVVHPETVIEPEFEVPEKISNAPAHSKRNFEQPPESKKDFVSQPISKKEFEPEPEFEDDTAPVFDRDGDEGRWRYDWQVAELVIYRYEFKKWPEDVSVETGLRSYYELRYFDEGTNRKGVKYSELYAKHRAKRDLWISQYKASGSVKDDLDTPTTESNVVHFPARRAGSSN